MAGVRTDTRILRVDESVPKPTGFLRTTQYTYFPLYKETDSGFAILGNHPMQTTTSYRSGSRGSADRTVEDLTAAQQKGYLLSDATHESGRKGSTQWDTGNEFSTTIYEPVELSLKRYSLRYRDTSGVPVMGYDGPILPSIGHFAAGSGTHSPWLSPGSFDPTWYSVQAIRRTTPTNPSAGLAIFLGELREKFPTAIGQVLAFGSGPVHSRVGQEFLNWEFGLKPMGRDLGEIAAAVLDASNRIKQLQRDSGKVIRRRYTFPEESITDQKPTRTGSGVLQNTANNTSSRWDPFFFGEVAPSGQFDEIHTTHRRIWFSGAYSYYLQSGNSFLDQIHGYEEKANAILGSRITASTLYELAPWSWLGDWFGNVGDNLANAAALSNDGLVLRYGYLMCTTVRERTVTVSKVRLKDGSTLPPVVAKFRTITKQRFRATPYGFALNPNSFTGRQWAILAALGLTKDARSLGYRS